MLPVQLRFTKYRSVTSLLFFGRTNAIVSKPTQNNDSRYVTCHYATMHGNTSFCKKLCRTQIKASPTLDQPSYVNVRALAYFC